MESSELHIIEIIRRVEDCATRPFLCKCSDGETYVIKGMPRLPRKQLIAEWLSANLAKHLNLSIPEFRLVYVSDEIVALANLVPDLRGDLEEGYAFATKFMHTALPITFTQAHNDVELTSRKLIYLFDLWVNNSDRTLSPSGTGNVNLLFDLKNNGYYLIDHNLAFDHDEHQREFGTHVYCPAHRDWRFDWVDREMNEVKLSDSIAVFDELTETIPDEWKIEDPDDHQHFITFMRETLNRTFSDEFWRRVE